MRSHCYCIPDYGSLTLNNVQSASQILESLLSSVNERKRSRGISIVVEEEAKRQQQQAYKSLSDKKTNPTMSRIDLLKPQITSYSQTVEKYADGPNKRVKLYELSIKKE